MVVLRGEHDEAVGTVERSAESLDVFAVVLPRVAQRRRSVEERQLVLAQVDDLDSNVGAPVELRGDPGVRPSR